MARDRYNETACLSTPAYRCVLCGYWQAAEVAPVMPLSKKEFRQEGRQLQRAPKSHTHELLEPFIESIRTLRKSRSNWNTIADLIRQATGSRIKAKTLIRYCNSIKLEAPCT